MNVSMKRLTGVEGVLCLGQEDCGISESLNLRFSWCQRETLMVNRAMEIRLFLMLGDSWLHVH